MKAPGTNGSSERLLSISLKFKLYIFTATNTVSKFIFSGEWEKGYIPKVQII